jgi:hypothetical protein
MCCCNQLRLQKQRAFMCTCLHDLSLPQMYLRFGPFKLSPITGVDEKWYVSMKAPCSIPRAVKCPLRVQVSLHWNTEKNIFAQTFIFDHCGVLYVEVLDFFCLKYYLFMGLIYL